MSTQEKVSAPRKVGIQRMSQLGLLAEPAGAVYVDGANLYQFVQDDPINHVDPTGLSTGDENDQHGALGSTYPFVQDLPPTFAGFTDPRYQMNDELIWKVVHAFNQNKGAYSGGTPAQCQKIPDLTVAVVKSWLIQETGGGDRRSRDAWSVDPAQVNVPGQDWDASAAAKTALGLQQPTARNQGDIQTNLVAAVGFLVRKGFNGAALAARPQDAFKDWKTALMLYNGRTAITTNGKQYRENYADQILMRAADPNTYYPIELPQPVRGR